MTDYTIPAGLAELVDRHNWVNWNREERNGRLTKIPYQPSTTGAKAKAKAGDPSTWDTFEVASAAHAAGRFDGIGYEFHAGEGYFGIDIDGCRDPETKQLTPLARAIISLADTYAEPSPSGTGIHIIGRGAIPRPELPEGQYGTNKGGFEFYGGAHFFTMTFRPLGIYNTINDVDPATMRRLFALMWPQDSAPKQERPAPARPAEPVTGDDAALLEYAFARKGGDDFRRWHDGGDLLGNPSRDDFGYLGKLYYWTQGDQGRMRRIALASARVRDKWHEKRPGGDWLDYSIARICKEGGEVYDPGRNRFPLPSSPKNEDAGEYMRSLAERDELIATLAADVQRLGDEVRRLVAENADLRATVGAWEEATRHPDQTIGGSAFDLAEAVQSAYQRGDVLTQDGQDYARVVIKQAAKRRSATTNGHALKRIKEAGEIDVITREEEIETDTFKGKVEITYVAVPTESRRRTADIVRSLLPTPTEKKHGGARPRIQVPRSQEYPDAPVRRVTETWEKFFCAADQQLLDSTRIRAHTDYFTSEGEAITFDEAQAILVAQGHQPPAAPGYRPQQTRIQVEDIVNVDTRIQDESGPLDDEPPADGCRACGRPRVVGTLFCERHRPGGEAWQTAAYERGYRGAGDYAAGDD